jgi:predicted small secreted protein
MPVTGELIRMMNYVDDIAATLRRIQAGITTMTEDEKKRLADYMRKADPNYTRMVDVLDKG